MRKCTFLLWLPIVLGQFEYEEPLLYDTFPEDFVWGVATSAYQASQEEETKFLLTTYFQGSVP